jgi:hypothetical protein
MKIDEKTIKNRRAESFFENILDKFVSAYYIELISRLRLSHSTQTTDTVMRQ